MPILFFTGQGSNNVIQTTLNIDELKTALSSQGADSYYLDGTKWDTVSVRYEEPTGGQTFFVEFPLNGQTTGSIERSQILLTQRARQAAFQITDLFVNDKDEGFFALDVSIEEFPDFISAASQSFALQETFLTPTNLTFVNDSVNQWYQGTPVGQSDPGIFISNDGSNLTYTNNVSQVSHAYIDINVGIVPEKALLKFDWLGYGESFYDHLRIYIVDSSITPQDGSQLAQPVVATLNGRSTLKEEEIDILNYIDSPGSYRVIVSWINDFSSGFNPSAYISSLNLEVFYGRPANQPSLLISGLSSFYNGLYHPSFVKGKFGYFGFDLDDSYGIFFKERDGGGHNIVAFVTQLNSWALFYNFNSANTFNESMSYSISSVSNLSGQDFEVHNSVRVPAPSSSNVDYIGGFKNAPTLIYPEETDLKDRLSYSALPSTFIAYPPATVTFTGGDLPDGVTVNSQTGELTGTPIIDNASNGVAILTVTNSLGSSTLSYPWTMQFGEPVLSYSTNYTHNDGQSYSYMPTYAGSIATSFQITVGALPPGLTLDATTGEISGTIVEPASSSGSATIRIGNPAGSDTYTFTWFAT